MDRKLQQVEFISQVTDVLRPVRNVIAHPERFNPQERARIRAQFHIDHQNLLNALADFCKSEPGAEYAVEWHDIQGPGARINNLVRKHLVENPAEAAEEIEKERLAWILAISAVPVPVDTTIYDAQTPFSAYWWIRALCTTTRMNLFYCDRYVSHVLFHRFLEGVPTTTQITVVTWPRAKHGNPRAYDNFIDVSKLFAKERPSTYRLLVKPDFHDRWLQSDGQIFHLGGSVKDAADTTVYTVSRLDPTAENLRKVADLVNTATELYGATTTTHP